MKVKVTNVCSPFTLHTEASFLRMSDTTSLCRSNFGLNFSMCALYSSNLFSKTSFFYYYLFTAFLLKISCFWYPGAEAAPGSWCLLGHHVTESAYAVTFKGTFEPILGRFNIHMRHLTSSSHFVKSCWRWVRKCQVVARFGLLPSVPVEENGAERLAATGPRKASVPPGGRTQTPPSTATHGTITKYHFYYSGVLNSMIYSII